MADRETVRETEGTDAAPARRLDLLGLRCPLPALKIRKALACLEPSGELVAETDDPLAGVDVPNVVREMGGELLEARRDAGRIVFRIRRGADSADPG